MKWNRYTIKITTESVDLISCMLAELGIEEKLKNWHSLGAIDEDEILRRMELHLDELQENLKGDSKEIQKLIEKRRRRIEK